MEFRKLEINLVSANNLPDVRNFGMMKVYAKVSINGESKTRKKTPIDMQGGISPIWNFPIEYTIGEAAVEKQGLNLCIGLYCKRTFGDKFIGEVKIPIKSLFDKGIKSEEILSYSVAGTPKGRLNISYSFGEKFMGRKPSSNWKKGMLGVGFLVLLGGAMLLLGDDDHKSDHEENDAANDDDCYVHRTADGEVFYECSSI